MSAKAKSKYLTKSVKYGSTVVTLYSLDGLIWSSRRDELPGIHARHEQERVTFAQIKGETKEEVETPEATEEAKPAGRDDEPAELLPLEEAEDIAVADIDEDEEEAPIKAPKPAKIAQPAPPPARKPAPKPSAARPVAAKPSKKPQPAKTAGKKPVKKSAARPKRKAA